MKSSSSMREMEDFTFPNVGTRFKKMEEKFSNDFSQTSLVLLPTFWGWWSQLLLVDYSRCLPILLLKFSNLHNYWSVGPKIMKFVLLQSLFRDACTQFFFLNLKIEWDPVTYPKTGLSIVRIFGPLGVEPRKIINIILPKLQTICKRRWELTKLINTITNLDPKVTNSWILLCWYVISYELDKIDPLHCGPRLTTSLPV